jgi:hypothetical protein
LKLSNDAARGLAAPGLMLLLAGCTIQPVAETVQREVRAIEESPWGDPDEVVAEVNGREITRGDYYRRVLEKFGTLVILSGIIKQELFMEEVERRGLTVSDAEVTVAVDKRLAEEAAMVGGENPMEALRQTYAEQGMTLEDVRRDYAQIVEPQLLVAKVVKAMRTVDEEALRQYYQQTYAKPRYRVSHIAYRYAVPGASTDFVEKSKQDALAKALRTVGRVREGEDFKAIARQESEDEATWRQGGDMGYISKDTPMHPAIREAIFELSPGEVSTPVDYEEMGSIHVFRMDEVVPDRGFAEVRETLEKELLEREPDLEEIEAALEALRERADIRIFGHPAGTAATG